MQHTAVKTIHSTSGKALEIENRFVTSVSKLKITQLYIEAYMKQIRSEYVRIH